MAFDTYLCVECNKHIHEVDVVWEDGVVEKAKDDYAYCSTCLPLKDMLCEQCEVKEKRYKESKYCDDCHDDLHGRDIR